VSGSENVGYELKQWQYTRDMIEDVVNFRPHLIVCDISTYRSCASEDQALEFLMKIREAFEWNNYPLNLVAIPNCWGELQDTCDFVEGLIASPIDPVILLGTIKRLLE